ncbi:MULTISPECIES: hypothetical protein [unclassified Streptomyces]|uniref:hypothetical protein n=1 Tax=unclassified Streptomyces TaxID=2593676 RepID=UPI00202E9518|nr:MULTISPECIES: hypothetical protein [unclassified Streptomyces]MCM1967668.1 hypothetical protein [Streptomyces sp. G1]MCX5125903.1 hypothetical protein [Streptomyces sp. NBC_00347]
MEKEPICGSCGQIVRVEQDRILPHWLSRDMPFRCAASGRQALGFLAKEDPLLRRYRRTRATPATLRGRSGYVHRVFHDESRRSSRAEDNTPVPAPPWLPAQGGGHLPAVALPGSGPTGIWLPRRSMRDHERLVAGLLPTTHSLQWNGDRKCWTFTKRHFLSVTGKLLRSHERIVLGREYNPDEKCNAACKGARLPECTCSCRAKYHGRGGWMRGWTAVEEFDSRYRGAAWHWTVFTRERR